VRDTTKKIQDIKDDVNGPKAKAKIDKDSKDALMQTKPNGTRDKLSEAIAQDNQNFIEGQAMQQERILLVSL
jgi:hypothetical protein